MKLVIFTPAMKASAIGRMTSLVTRSLAGNGHEVVVVRAEDETHQSSPPHDFGVELVPWTDSDQVASLTQSADALVYQIGDNYPYHRGCLEWLPRAPGIVCLHDFYLGNLFYGWAQHHGVEAEATLRAWYGTEAAERFFRYDNFEAFIDGTKDAAPMTEWVCSLAHGIITHSSWGIQRVLKSCPGPVRVVPLAYDAPNLSALHPIDREAHRDRFNVLTIGHVNPNKRAESVIRAIGNSAVLRRNTTYRLVGHIQPDMSEHLASLARSLQVNLVISGKVDSDTLLQAIGEAHVICCLRWPSLEAASASAIEAMLYGKPVVVTDTGFYSELPDVCVRKIRIQNEIPELQQALEHLCENEGERLALGAKAAEWAAVTFSAEIYANQLIAVSLAAQRAAPMLKATQFLAGTLWQWGASPALMTLSDMTEPLRLFDSCHEAARDGVGA